MICSTPASRAAASWRWHISGVPYTAKRLEVIKESEFNHQIGVGFARPCAVPALQLSDRRMQIGRYTPGGQIAAEDVTGRHKSENGSDPLSRYRTLKAAVQRGHMPDLDIRTRATRLRSSPA